VNDKLLNIALPNHATALHFRFFVNLKCIRKRNFPLRLVDYLNLNIASFFLKKKIAAGFFLPRRFLANSTPIFTRFKKNENYLKLSKRFKSFVLFCFSVLNTFSKNAFKVCKVCFVMAFLYYTTAK
jgi:hypothetical protein